jgi:sterol desaturase/sphingolipid hydroxylase (fatty acid hydroxylase superfamily)
MTFMLFVAFELGYWMNHYLSHKIPVLWAFHKVHHCAESLSPLTDFRVHPIYTVIFYNIVAVTMGLMEGMGRYLLGDEVAEFSIGGMNVLLLATGILLVHLQHSHFWISFSGRLGLFISSPAHHQIHHSADPAHYDRNFGGSLAIWDHLFGTLHLPSKKREKLRFGMPALDYNPHSLRAGFLIPFREALEALRPRREPRQVEKVAARQVRNRTVGRGKAPASKDEPRPANAARDQEPISPRARRLVVERAGPSQGWLQ